MCVCAKVLRREYQYDSKDAIMGCDVKSSERGVCECPWNHVCGEKGIPDTEVVHSVCGTSKCFWSRGERDVSDTERGRRKR